MSPIEAIHNAARQYCIDRGRMWHARYAELQRTTVPVVGGGSTYTQEAYNIFPRYNALKAIQNEVERFVPADFSVISEARSILALAGETAFSQFTKTTNPTADADERDRFIKLILNLNDSQLVAQERLTHRRVLGTAEHRSWHDAVLEKWGRWYGGHSDRLAPKSEVITLHDAVMDDPRSYQHIQDVLHEVSLPHILELREYDDGFEISVDAAEFTYNGAEGFWTDPDLGWLVHASHESSITFASPWLIGKMREVFPSFDRYIYKGWDRAAYT